MRFWETVGFVKIVLVKGFLGRGSTIKKIIYSKKILMCFFRFFEFSNRNMETFEIFPGFTLTEIVFALLLTFRTKLPKMSRRIIRMRLGQLQEIGVSRKFLWVGGTRGGGAGLWFLSSYANVTRD